METLGLLTLAAMAIALFLGGTVKGAMGIGLPMVAVPTMAIFVDVPTAVAVMTLPLIATNLWQALQLGWPAELVRRFWPVMVTLTLSLWWSTGLVARADPRILFAVLGTFVIAFCVLEIVSIRLRVSPRWEKPWGFAAGAAGGVVGGLSSAFAPPITLYLVALGLAKDDFVRAVGVLFSVGSVMLATFYWSHGVLNADNIGWSAAALAPALGGLLLGQFVRRRIQPQLFRKILLVLLVFIGLNLLRRAFF